MERNIGRAKNHALHKHSGPPWAKGRAGKVKQHRRIRRATSRK